MTGVRSAHVDMGYDDLSVFHNPQLQRIIAGMRRMRGEAHTKEREPITKDLLLELLPRCDQSTKEGSVLHASYCLAFAGFLRVGEFTYTAHDLHDQDFSQWFLTRRSVKLWEDCLEVTLPASKNDPFRQGITLTVAATGDEACAVSSLRHLFTRFEAAAESPLFQIAQGVPFTRKIVTDTLRQGLRALGVEGFTPATPFDVERPHQLA